MAWADAVERAHAAFLSTWGISATWTPQGGQARAVAGVIKNPGMEEELRPGGSSGTTAVRLWVDSNTLSPEPAVGDLVSIAGVEYTVGSIDVDVEGGMVLKLRRNS